MSEAIKVYATAFMLSLSILFTLVFNLAVLNGGKATLWINKYGEMVPELLLLHLIVWPVISVAIYIWFVE